MSGNTTQVIIASTKASITTNDLVSSDLSANLIPECIIHGSDNWFSWLSLGLLFITCLISLYCIMTRKIGIEISKKRWGNIVALITASLAISSIITSIIMTVISISIYKRCNVLQSQHILTPWNWEEQWETDSLFGFIFWGIGLILSCSVYGFILNHKFKMSAIKQLITEKVTFNEKACNYIYKFIFFVINFSFAAVIRPYYHIGRYNDDINDKCSCVDDNISLITEIYASALISIILLPCIYKLANCCIDQGDESQGNTKNCMKCTGYLFMLYAIYCIFLIIITPFLFIAIRILGFIDSVQVGFSSDDFSIIIWFFDAISNFFVN